MPTTELTIPLPPTIATALEWLKNGTINGKELTVTYKADQPQLMPMLRAISAGDEEQARVEMGNAVAATPWLFAHPCVHDTVAGIWASPYISETTRKNWTRTVASRMAQGLTFCNVEITERGSMPSGPTIACFPKLSETDCTFPTEESLQERKRACEFVELYEELHQGLETVVHWREITTQYRPHDNQTVEANNIRADSAVEELSYELRKFLRAFIRERSMAVPSISETEWNAIPRQGLNEVIKGKSPRREISAQLFAKLPLSPFDTARKAGKEIDSGFVLKTLETLRRHLGEERIEVIRYHVASRLMKE